MQLLEHCTCSKLGIPLKHPQLGLFLWKLSSQGSLGDLQISLLYSRDFVELGNKGKALTLTSHGRKYEDGAFTKFWDYLF